MSFIIYGSARSRTAWLSYFLSYKGIRCGHEQAVRMRNISDIPAVFANGNGSAETGVAQGHWLIRNLVPGIKQVVVKRPVDEVVASLLALDLRGIASYDPVTLRKHIEYADRMLNRISELPGTLTITPAELDSPEVAARLFEFCLSCTFDEAWYIDCLRMNIQLDMPQHIRYFWAHAAEITAFKLKCKRYLRELACANNQLRSAA